MSPAQEIFICEIVFSISDIPNGLFLVVSLLTKIFHPFMRVVRLLPRSSDILIGYYKVLTSRSYLSLILLVALSLFNNLCFLAFVCGSHNFLLTIRHRIQNRVS